MMEYKNTLKVFKKYMGPVLKRYGFKFKNIGSPEFVFINTEYPTATIYYLNPDYSCASPYASDELIDYFGIDRPTEEMLSENDEFWFDIQRGMARYIILYNKDKPVKIFFAGYSFD